MDGPTTKEKLSIAVLPFTNMSGDPEQEYFADGMVEDIITALSQIRQFLVIARNSSFVYKGHAVDVRHVGRELGVRYVLEGSVRKAGNRLRITGQLVDTKSGGHVWADKFDGDMKDVFDLQDRLTEDIVAAIEPSLRNAEIDRARGKPTEDLDAYDFYLRGLSEQYAYTREGHQAARQFFERALKRDPSYAEAWASLADCVGRAALFGWVDDVDEGRRLSCEAAIRGVHLDPDNGPVLAIAAWALAVMEGRVEQAIEYTNRALKCAPNSAPVLSSCAWALVYNAETEKSIECYSKARGISPFDPRRGDHVTCLAAAQFFSRRFEECIQSARRVLVEAPGNASARRFMAAGYVQTGDMTSAERTIAELMAFQPSSSISRTAKTSRFRHRWMIDLYLDSLRAAGLPE